LTLLTFGCPNPTDSATVNDETGR